MSPQECPSWEGCAAPLCPLEPVPEAQWFPDEDVCKSRHSPNSNWVKTQRKILRLFLKGRIGDDLCFTLPMLEAIKAVRRPKGLRPEDLYRNGIDQTLQDMSISHALPLKQP